MLLPHAGVRAARRSVEAVGRDDLAVSEAQVSAERLLGQRRLARASVAADPDHRDAIGGREQRSGACEQVVVRRRGSHRWPWCRVAAAVASSFRSGQVVDRSPPRR